MDVTGFQRQSFGAQVAVLVVEGTHEGSVVYGGHAVDDVAQLCVGVGGWDSAVNVHLSGGERLPGWIHLQAAPKSQGSWFCRTSSWGCRRWRSPRWSSRGRSRRPAYRTRPPWPSPGSAKTSRHRVSQELHGRLGNIYCWGKCHCSKISSVFWGKVASVPQHCFFFLSQILYMSIEFLSAKWKLCAEKNFCTYLKWPYFWLKMPRTTVFPRKSMEKHQEPVCITYQDCWDSFPVIQEQVGVNWILRQVSSRVCDK